MEIVHTAVNVSDGEQIADWYVEELGFNEAWEFTTPDEETLNVYLADDAGHELQLSDSVNASPDELGTAWDHIAIEVADVDETFESVDNHGVIQEPTTYDSIDVRVAFIRDPDGRVVEIVEEIN